jgi:fission process protein 1
VTSRNPAVEVVDTFLWQGFASIALPGIVINRVVWGAAKFAKSSKSVLPTLVGLAVIPLIVRPIDVAVDKVMDETVRKLW